MKKQNQASVPFLSPKKIKAKADAFRAKYWGNIIPVDIEGIIEFKLGLEIRPISNLSQRSDIEAGISSNWKIVFVDKNTYEDERRTNRLRFSLAHEIGHLALHKEVFKSIGIQSMEEYYDFTEEKITNGHTFHNHVETQAGIFANMLLIPREELLPRRDALLKIKWEELQELNISDTRILNPYLAKELADEFHVSEEAMTVALDNLEKDLSK